jgi:hypothetical protein
MKKLTITLLIVFTVIIICKAQEASTNEGWKTYETKDYTFQYPVDWKLDTSQKSIDGTGGVYILSPNFIEGDELSEMTKLLITDYGKKITLDRMVADLESVYNASDSLRISAWLEKSERRKIGDVVYQEMIINNGINQRKLKFVYYIFVKGNILYTFGYSAPQDNFYSFFKTGSKILNSFNLK